MPVTRGKKKTKRERRRFGAAPSIASEDQPDRAAAKPVKPARRRGWQPPMWVNVLFGVTLVLGGPFFASIFKGGFFILVAYWILGGFYLFRAYRQYQEKRTS